MLWQYWAIEHACQGHYFFHLRPELLSLPRQWCQPDHRATLGVYSYEAYRYLLDLDEVSLEIISFAPLFETLLHNCSNAWLLSCSQVELRPFTCYEGFDWALLNSA